jgi:regulator of RNase E activity RraA
MRPMALARRSPLLALCIVGGAFTPAGCIKRTAAPKGPAPVAGSARPAVDDSKPSPVQEAANARIATLPHVDLLGPDGVKAFQPMGEVAKVTLTPITVAGQPFSDAVRVDIKEGSSHEYAVQMATKIIAPVKTGDAILATFYLRTETPQEGSVGETEFVFELAGSPYTKSVSYPVQGPESWTRVQVRFESVADYAPGEAQMIFRLGYDPQVIELGGVRVESYGKQLAVEELPTSQPADRRRERAAAKAAKAAANQTAILDGGPLAIQIEPARVIRPISPYVYGINSQPPGATGATVRRMGGNRQTAYNWEINGSSAGSDYQQSSDDWPCTVLGYTGCKTQPGAQFLEFAQANRKLGLASVATIPIVDYVVADENGTVTVEEKAPSKRWHRSFPQKPGAPGSLSLTPDLTDDNVYQDELVNLLVKKLGPADRGGIKFYSLDNEPALWPTTHPRVHPDKTTYAEMVKRTEATASAVVALDPSAVVLGGVMFGWSEYMSLSDAPDSAANNETFGSYLDFFLASMKKLEEKHKQRLVHVLDIHWYPEARGARRITDADLSPKTVSARLQAVRSLWDPTYVEKSWIASQLGKPIRLIPWMRERIEARYPGTQLGMTEYNFGAGDHISGGLAQIDALGVFGREGLYLANYWGDGPGNGDLPKYIAAAFKLYRNYDGAGGMFGDTAVEATADANKASVFAATDAKRPGVLTVVAINKELRTAYTGAIALGAGGQTKARVFTVDASSPDVKARGEVDIGNGQLTYRLPPLSATLFVCEKR